VNAVANEFCKPPFLTRLVVKNYKSIAHADVRFANPTFLVGPNGSGKSNLLDAIQFVADALKSTLGYALGKRGGFESVVRQGAPEFEVQLEISRQADYSCHYGFAIGRDREYAPIVLREECKVQSPMDRGEFRRDSGTVLALTHHPMPAPVRDRLHLVVASGLVDFKTCYDTLCALTIYNPAVQQLRHDQEVFPPSNLLPDARNLTSVLRTMEPPQGGEALAAVTDYLSAIASGVVGVSTHFKGSGGQNFQFQQRRGDLAAPVTLYSHSMSDGTLRALCILVALFQPDSHFLPKLPLVGIEEPEASIHPGAAAVLFGAIIRAAQHRQILVSTHSPDLLDDEDLITDCILAVEMVDGETRVGPLDAASKQIVKERLHTVGELMRTNQLTVAEEETPYSKPADS